MAPPCRKLRVPIAWVLVYFQCTCLWLFESFAGQRLAQKRCPLSDAPHIPTHHISPQHLQPPPRIIFPHLECHCTRLVQAVGWGWGAPAFSLPACFFHTILQPLHEALLDPTLCLSYADTSNIRKEFQSCKPFSPLT